MNVKAKRTWLALVLASSLALGENAPPAAEHATPAPAPVPVPAPLPDRVTDLDFSEDFPVPNHAHSVGPAAEPGSKVTRKLPSSAAVAPPEPSRTWAYWTAGITALAAGGAAWYLHWGARPPPDPARDNQVFTDEPD